MSPLFWFYGSVGLTYAGEALRRLDRRVVRLSRARTAARGRCTGARYPRPGRRHAPVACSSCSFRCGSAARCSASARAARCWSGGDPRGGGPRLVRADDLAQRGPGRYVAASTQLYGSVVLPPRCSAARSRSRSPRRAICSSPPVGWSRSASLAVALPGHPRRTRAERGGLAVAQRSTPIQASRAAAVAVLVFTNA